MKFMPPKLNYYTGISSTNHGGLVLSSIFPSEAQRLFDAWYAREITPLFENAIQVYGDLDHQDSLGWTPGFRHGHHTHSGIIINIKPIKEESAEDLLKEWVDWIDNVNWVDNHTPSGRGHLYDKAKAYLEKNNKET